MSNPNTSQTQFQLDKRIVYVALNACGVGLAQTLLLHMLEVETMVIWC